MSGTSPPPTTTTECPLSFAWFYSYLALHPPIRPGRFPFSALFTLGHLGIPSGVGPEGTHRSHSHPSKGFPCPLPWTLQRGLGGGYLIPYAAHCGTQPGNGVTSRLTRFSRPTCSCPQVFWVRSSDTLRNGSSCYPIRCGEVGGPFPVGQNPLQLDSPCHVLSQARHLRDTPSLHRAFQGHAAHPAERPATLSPNGSPPPWQKERSYEVSFFHSFHGTVFTAHISRELPRALASSGILLPNSIRLAPTP